MNRPSGVSTRAPFLEKRAIVRQVFDHFERHHQIERFRGHWDGGAGRFQEAQTRNRVTGARVFDRIGGNVHARHRGGGLRELGRSISRAAARVKNAFAWRILSREGVAGDVLAPEVVVHLARNYPFSGEFNQRPAPLAGVPGCP